MVFETQKFLKLRFFGCRLDGVSYKGRHLFVSTTTVPTTTRNWTVDESPGSDVVVSKT